jgi:3'(2'), 5'-bisphosphate nucleotidase
MQNAITPEEVQRDLAFAIEAAELAGSRVLRLRATGRWEDEKTMADIGDQAADGFLQGFVRGRYPDDGILSEETGDSADRLGKSRVWIVDPLDGTKEFSQGRDDWAVHVALVVDGRCAVGAVALPAQGSTLWGVAVPGQERGGIRGEGTLVRGSEPRDGGHRVVMSRSHTPPWMERFCEEIGSTESLRCGSVGNKVTRLLLGLADVYVHKVGLKEWDTCAPEVVARALGWSVCKLRGEEHRYNRREYRNHELVVCRPTVRNEVLRALGACGALAD